MAAIKNGLKVQIEFESGFGKKTRIDCYILDHEDDRIELMYPASKEEFIPYLSEGTELKAFIYTFGGIQVLDSIVLNSPLEDFTIEYHEDTQVIQRRKYLRVPFNTEIFISLPEGNKKSETLDISGGGIRFAFGQTLENQKVYNGSLRLEKYDSLIFFTGIVSKKNFFKPDEYVIEFTEIDEKQREKIIQKCVEIDRMNNKKV